MQLFPNSSLYSFQWNYFEYTAGINIEKAWDVTTGSEKTVIAVLDTGISYHENLINKILKGRNFVNDRSDPYDVRDLGNFHGTHVAGIIAANGYNYSGISGIDWKAKILPIRILDNNGQGNLISLLEGLTFAGNYAKVINLSLGAYGECPYILQDAIDDLVKSKNITIVSAAGNQSTYAGFFSPGNCEHIITVAAVNRYGFATYYTNFGEEIITIAAPGGEFGSYYQDGILSTISINNFEYFQGTSMAAPHVTGVIGLMYAIDSNLTPDGIKKIISASAKGQALNVGILDAYAALEYTKLTLKKI